MQEPRREGREGDVEPVPGAVLVCQPGAAASYWQPMPANGHVEVIFAPDLVAMPQPLGFGTQTLPPGGHVREQAHDHGETVIYVLRGRGRAVIEGVEHPMRPGTAFYLGRHRRHIFVNEGDENLVFTWLMVPNGLDASFRDVGRQRQPGERAPGPFARLADLSAGEREVTFSPSPAPRPQP